MMASESNRSINRSSRTYFLVFATAVLLFGGYQAWRWYATPPDLGASPEARKTLDGLFTAFTTRDEAKLATCMERIEVHFAEGRLSEKAVNELRNCSEMAKADSWETAAKRLYWIIFEQAR